MASDKQTVDFIDDYRGYTLLWDINDKLYTNKNKRNDAYRALGEKYNMDVKSKIKNLRSCFSREQQKMSSVKSGAGADEKYESSWFAYKHLLFIGDSITPRSTKDTLTTQLIEGGEEVIQENNSSLPETEEPQTEATANSYSDQRKSLPYIQTSRGLKRKMDDDRKKEEQAYGFLELAEKSLTDKDDCSIFGEMFAAQLRKLTPRHQAITRNKIQNIIFDLEMQEINVTINGSTRSYEYYNISPQSTYSSNNEPTRPHSAGGSTSQLDNVLGEVQPYLCFDLDKNNIS